MRGGPIRGRRKMPPSAARPIRVIGPIASSIRARPRPIRSRAFPHPSRPRSSARWHGARRSFRATGRASFPIISPQPRGRSRFRRQSRPPGPTSQLHQAGPTLSRFSPSSRNLPLQRHRGRLIIPAACFRATRRSPSGAGCFRTRSGRTRIRPRRSEGDLSRRAAASHRRGRWACPALRQRQVGQHLHRGPRRSRSCKTRSRPAAPRSIARTVCFPARLVNRAPGPAGALRVVQSPVADIGFRLPVAQA